MNKNYAAIYKDGDTYTLIEIPFEMIQNNNFDPSKFNVYSLDVKKESLVNPEIKFIKKNSGTVKIMSVDDAVIEITKSDVPFIVFFNSETHFLNIIYKKAKSLELLVPAF